MPNPVSLKKWVAPDLGIDPDTLPNPEPSAVGVPICTTSVGRSKEGRVTCWNVGLSCMKEIQEMQYGGNVSKVLT